MDDDSALGAGPVIDRLAARHPQALVPCLVQVGLRRALWRYAGLGYVARAEVADLAARGWAAWRASGAFGDVPPLLADRAAGAARPLAACAECPAACRVRPLVLGGLGARVTRTREGLRRERPGQEHVVLIPAASDLVVELAGTLSAASANAAALCVVAHAAHREGLGDGVGLVRLRAMSDQAAGR